MRFVQAPRGNQISCHGWQQEGVLRMLMNNLDPMVAEKPDKLIVYGGTGRAARNWDSFERIVAALKNLKNDETLLVQSGKPVAVFKTHNLAPRVLISNAMLVPAWATQEFFNDLESKGLTMYGQMTAGSWIYIGTQGILQHNYETYSTVGRLKLGGSLKGKVVLTAGLGGMGGAQPLAVTMTGGIGLVVEVDAGRIRRRIDTGYLDTMVEDLDKAIKLIEEAKKNGKGISIGLLGNAAIVFNELAATGFRPDIVTDQTSAHDLLSYVPIGRSVKEAEEMRRTQPEQLAREARESICHHVKAMLKFQKAGCVVFEYGNNIRQQALAGGVEDAFNFPGFASEYVRPLFCEGRGPFRWVALSGDPEDIYKIDDKVEETFSENESLVNWIGLARSKVKFQGLPARVCWLGYGERAKFGLVINDMVRKGKLSAPIVIGRDHFDCGSVASPNRETEAMLDGSDVIADWPILNALINTACGATWVSVHHGGGVGIGYAIHAGQAIVADGTEEADQRLQRVLTADPGLGVIRHADAGYEKAINLLMRSDLKAPSLKS